MSTNHHISAKVIRIKTNVDEFGAKHSKKNDTYFDQLVLKLRRVVVLVLHFDDDLLGDEEERLGLVEGLHPQLEPGHGLEVEAPIHENAAGVGVDAENVAQVAAGDAIADLLV